MENKLNLCIYCNFITTIGNAHPCCTPEYKAQEALEALNRTCERCSTKIDSSNKLQYCKYSEQEWCDACDHTMPGF